MNCWTLDKPMASLSTCHLSLWLGWQILLNLVKKKLTYNQLCLLSGIWVHLFHLHNEFLKAVHLFLYVISLFLLTNNLSKKTQYLPTTCQRRHNTYQQPVKEDTILTNNLSKKTQYLPTTCQRRHNTSICEMSVFSPDCNSQGSHKRMTTCLSRSC